MERLTQFNQDYYEIKDGKGNLIAPKYSKLDQVITKLGKLENIEEELDFSIEVIFEALKNGIYIKNILDEMINFKCMLVYKNEEIGWYFHIINGYVLLKDYKKTWWLKADKSE